MEDGLVFNATDGAKKLGITADELGKKYDSLKKGEGIIKFGGGFYCGKVDDIYVTWQLSYPLSPTESNHNIQAEYIDDVSVDSVGCRLFQA